MSGSAPAAGETLFGAHWDWNRYAEQEPFLRRLTGSHTYYELSWCDVEKTPGRPDWSTLDRVARLSRDLGIALDLKIRVGLCWATGGTPQFTRGQAGKTESAMPRDLSRYRAFVTSLVGRYRPYGVHTYAVENEVNAQQYWAGTPQQYADLVRAAATAIHAADPAATVADSGISSVALGMGVADRLLAAGRDDAAVAAYRAYFARRIGTRGKQIPDVRDAAGLRQALAHPTNARNLAYLAVTRQLLDQKIVQVRQVHFYETPDGVPSLLDFVRATTPSGIAVQAWEVGRFDKTASASDPVVAREMTQVVTLLAAGGVRDIMWLPLAYNPDNRAGAEVRAGLLDPDGTLRPAGTAMAALAAAARGATARPVTVAGLTGVGFTSGASTGAARTTLVVWATGKPVATPQPGPAVRPLAGAAVSGGGGRVIGADPVQVTSREPFDKAVAALTR
ncbi:hypothetical protein GCM10012284_47930 [Mangrovihabitans endophyticus]|uniref:Uncharacterized protein n=1 Tax=Mangrovihabitans endophyticus TaxID=1751298 RepID=A0A8J3FRA1_9ACTN|nr:hypothetical protein GCM10012284_47930 [Mangrovihabitans endophyticus]